MPRRPEPYACVGSRLYNVDEGEGVLAGDGRAYCASSQADSFDIKGAGVDKGVADKGLKGWLALGGSC